MISAFCRPGDDLLSQVLRHSTIGAGAFDGRVRDGIGSGHSARATRPAKRGSLKQISGGVAGFWMGRSSGTIAGSMADHRPYTGLYGSLFTPRIPLGDRV